MAGQEIGLNVQGIAGRIRAIGQSIDGFIVVIVLVNPVPVDLPAGVIIAEDPWVAGKSIGPLSATGTIGNVPGGCQQAFLRHIPVMIQAEMRFMVEIFAGIIYSAVIASPIFVIFQAIPVDLFHRQPEIALPVLFRISQESECDHVVLAECFIQG